MKQYCITDDLEVVARAAANGVDLIQIRAKHLPTRALIALVENALRLAGPTPVLLNTRADIALAYGAAGVHLPSNSVPPNHIRRIAPAEFLIGVSCHTIPDLQQAQSESADFAVYGPIFPTGDKHPIGLDALRQATATLRLPIYALGGITPATAQSCLDAGAHGIAGISLFR